MAQAVPSALLLVMDYNWLESFFYDVGARDGDAAEQSLVQAWEALPAARREAKGLCELKASLDLIVSRTRAGRSLSDDAAGACLESWGPVAVQQLLGRGRGLVAKRDIARGEKIFWQRPAIWVHEPDCDAPCAGCLKRKVQGARSIVDGGLTYCAQPCHSLAKSAFHGPLCEVSLDSPACKAHIDALRELQAGLWDHFPGVIGLVLSVLAAFVQEARTLHSASGALEAMQARGLLPTPSRESAPLWENLGVPGVVWDSPEARTKILNEAEGHLLPLATSFASLLEGGAGKEGRRDDGGDVDSSPATTKTNSGNFGQLFGVDWTVSELFGQIDTVLMWCGGNRNQVAGVAVVPSVALLNHSCIPNISIDFDRNQSPAGADCILCASGNEVGSDKAGTWARATAKRDIQEGEELTISYVDRSESVAVRQRILRQFCFQCSCPKCIWET